MAEMSPADRQLCMDDYAQVISARRGDTFGIDKPALLAAVDALDTFLNDNAAAVNNALPEPAKSTLTIPQKAELLSLVIKWRYIVGA